MTNSRRSLVLITLAFGFAATLLSQTPCGDDKRSLAKTAVNDNYAWFTINNIFNPYGNNGNSSYNIATGNSGFEFPKGSGKTVIFEDGVLWGGFHKGRAVPKVGGSAYRYGLQAGRILTPGGPLEPDTVTADDPRKAEYRVFRVRRDIGPAAVFTEVESLLEKEADLISRYSPVSAADLFSQYQTDWNEWPAKSPIHPDGIAPFEDVNENGMYEPATDIPGQVGADQTLYYIANDASASRTTNLYFSPPIGLEMHRTVWGYDRSGALGNTIFSSTLLINKSGAPVDSMFLGQWSDPDLGGAADDYVGCDVPRSLGFVYNGRPTDEMYGSAVPSAGYTLVQGPLKPSTSYADSAIFRLQYRKQYLNQKMTSFVPGTCGSTLIPCPSFGLYIVSGIYADYEIYALLNGRFSSIESLNPVTGLPTKFVMDGDPVKGTGWLDGTYGLMPGDRRLLLSTGPFTLANGDSQEIVVATIVGDGADRISSVSVLKHYSDIVQEYFSGLLHLPQPPPSPVVTAGEFDGQIALSWSDSVGSRRIENWNSADRVFEGYNIYQYESPAPGGTAGVKVATFDIKNGLTFLFDDVFDPASGLYVSRVVQTSKDSGIRRHFETRRDSIGGRPLVNGTKYYFGVTAYAYSRNEGSSPAFLESEPTILTLTPQWQQGFRYATSLGDSLAVTKHDGPSTGGVKALVINPAAVPSGGATYSVVFSGEQPRQVWHLLRSTGSRTDTVARNMVDQTGTEDQAVIVDGIRWIVQSAGWTFASFFTVANSNGPIVPWQQGAFAFSNSGFPRTPDGADGPNGTLQQPGVLSPNQGWGIHTGVNSPSMSSSFVNFVNRVTSFGARWTYIIPCDFEIRFTAAGGKALIPDALTGAGNHLIDVHFELWNSGIATPDDPSDDYRMFPNILDVDNSGGFNLLTQSGVDSVDNGSGDHIATHPISGDADDPFTDWIYWVAPADKTPGQAGYNAIVSQIIADIAGGNDPYLNRATTGGIDVLRRMVLVGWNFGSVATGAYAMQVPQTGTVFRIVTSKPNTSRDVFTFTVPAVVQSMELAKADAEKVNVYPNPFIASLIPGSGLAEQGITFTHLPRRAVIRVFTLAGTLVRTFVKDDENPVIRWDLTNDNGSVIAPGMYIAHIDMPDVGKVKILKFGAMAVQ